MAEPQISTVLIPCLVVQLNNQKFITDDEVIGKIEDVPCRNALIDEIEYWAVPVKDYGIFTTLDYILAIDSNSAPPTYDSFKVVRVRDKLTAYTWWIYGTKAQFINSCATCCGDAAVPMPGVANGFTLNVQPCDSLCIKDVNGNYVSYWGLPSLAGAQHYFPAGSKNNVPLPPASSIGYPNITSLLAFLNSNWTGFTWTNPGSDGLTLLATGGALADSLCLTVIAIFPTS